MKRFLNAMPEFLPIFNETVTDEEYHSNKNFIGSSQLRTILKSPKHFYWEMNGLIPKEEKEHFNLGKLAHMALLEGAKFKERYIIEPEFWGMTQKGERSNNCKESREKRENWFADLPQGAVVVTEEQRGMIVGMVESIMNHPQGPDLIKNGRAEVAGFFRDEETGIQLKIKPDFLSFDCQRFTDFKTTRDGSRTRFGSSAFSYRYDFQLLMYCEGIKAITGKFPEVITNMTVESKAPYECAIYYFEKEDLFKAEIDYRKALNLVREGIDTGIWPQRQKQIERIRIPMWFVNEGDENE